MRLEFDSVKFKNFLSFGSKWEELIFQHGINVILGPNGSGKSSCMETIPFALFGKTHKDIKKADLINWKNRKQLEVQLSFSKGDDQYKVIRAIKPDNFEIYHNDTLIDKLSHVRDYQALLEDIIGTNYQTFMSLIHSNINASKPILSMSKPDKRKFIEKVFGLSIYSTLIDKCNKKISLIDSKVRDFELTMLHNNTSIMDSKQNIKHMSLKLSSLGSSEVLLNETKEQLKALDIDDERYLMIEEEIKSVSIKNDDLKRILNKFKTKKTVIGTRVKDIIKRIPDKVEYETPETDYQVTYDATHITIGEFQKELQELDKDKASLTGELKGLKKKQELIKEGKCPTCGQDVKDNLITELDNDIKGLEGRIEDSNINHKRVDEYLTMLVNHGMDLSNKIEQQKIYMENEAKRKLLSYEKNKWKRVYVKLSKYITKFDSVSIAYENNLSVLTEQYLNENNTRKQYDTLSLELKALTDKISLENDTKKEFEAIITLEVNKVKKWEKGVLEKKQETQKLNDIKDYMTHIKFICKDENIKRFAISSIIPILVRNTNRYLSDIGQHPFYLQLDGWLEPVIKGPGITNGSYSNLSSGEGKCLDVSLQNAFLDIAKVQAGIYPDIQILDEILDSSIDSTSLDILLQIVNNKQKEDNSKVFIISHREEINDVDSVNTLLLEKKGGYSQILYK